LQENNLHFLIKNLIFCILFTQASDNLDLKLIVMGIIELLENIIANFEENLAENGHF